MSVDQSKVQSYQLNFKQFLEKHGKKIDDKWLIKFSKELIRETELLFGEIILVIEADDKNEQFVEQCRYDWSSYFSEDYFDFPDLLNQFIEKIFPQALVLLVNDLTAGSSTSQKVNEIQLGLDALIFEE